MENATDPMVRLVKKGHIINKTDCAQAPPLLELSAAPPMLSINDILMVRPIM
jgi:hypothetical protein